ncbi:MAG: DUF6600 domain-containing protein [Verrucomicrobiia bacterium]
MLGCFLSAVTALALGQINVPDRTPHVDRPTIDFDPFYLELAQHGTWSPNDTYKFVFRPHGVDAAWRPYRRGQWIYSDHGWTWRGSEKWSWATDHFGFWTRRGVSHWSWVPADFWLSATVEWIQSGDYVGWRPSILDRFSNMEESESLRYANPEEWNFIPKAKLGQPLTPADFASDDLAAELLAAHQPCDHVFVAWREIPRPGPAPVIDDPETGERIPIPVIHNLTSPTQVAQDTAESLFFYRPKFRQDADGIFRRIEILSGRSTQNLAASARQEIQTAVERSEPGPRLTREEREAQWKRMQRAHERELERWERLRR